ncbi:MAG: aminotransferase class I/II-fold pyridoxal phosphate-dependent enzyme [Rhodobacterales bacterium]|nr:aminotransferase class I/II-fold pyridoxal phosphate-dependent enzyme [Rhodobacterales bacterium]
MPNPNLDRLTDYPFDRLRTLLDGLQPPQGRAPLMLSIGEPKHAPPALIAQAVSADPSLWGRYPPIQGTDDLRQAIADWLVMRYGLPKGRLDIGRNILPVAGSREALFLVAQTVVPRRKHGRAPAVLMPNPFYQVYSGAAVMAGGDPVFLPATRDSGYLPDLDAIDRTTLDRTALMYLCSPANPQGAVADLDYLTRAIGLARRHGFVLAVDECYSEIHDGQPPAGALQACQVLDDGSFANVLVFHSLSKRSSAPGLRSGFVAGDGALVPLFRRLRTYGGASLPLPLQAASAALWRDETHVAENRALYQAKFDLADRIVGGRFGHARPAGGFFLWLDVGDGETAARDLWTRGGLRVLPGAYLARDDQSGANPGQPYIRVAMVHDLATMEDALTRLVAILDR